MTKQLKRIKTPLGWATKHMTKPVKVNFKKNFKKNYIATIQHERSKYETQSYQVGLNEGKKQSEEKIEMLKKEISELKIYLRGFKDATYYCGGSK